MPLSQIAYRTVAVLYGHELLQESAVMSAGTLVFLATEHRTYSSIGPAEDDRKTSEHTMDTPGSAFARDTEQVPFS
jgi:hypothetical protein